jgi:magnesium transporter
MTIKGYLFDRAGHDQEMDVDEGLIRSLSQDQILWIDLDCRGVKHRSKVCEVLGIDARAIDRLNDEKGEQRLDNYGDYYAFGVSAITQSVDDRPDKGIGETTMLGFLVGKLWLVTTHHTNIDFLRTFQAQDKGETRIGGLPPSLLAIALLDWHLAEFFHESSRIEADVDALDKDILAEGAQGDILQRVVANRTRVSGLRSLLATQRPIFHGLSRPDFVVDSEPEAVAQFAALGNRYDRAMDEIERTRDVVVSSFDLFTSMTTQKTNDLVKSLTFMTAIIGVCAAVAGLLGMNFDIPLFKTGMTGFMTVTLGILIMSIAAVVIAKMRDWV